MKKKELVETLQILGLDSTGKIDFLRARLLDYIILKSGEPKDPPEDINLKSLRPKNMLKSALKEILGKLGLPTLGNRPLLRSRLEDYIATNTKEEDFETNTAYNNEWLIKDINDQLNPEKMSMRN